MTPSATQSRFRIEGMDCAGCATKIDKAVRQIPGIEDVSVSVTAGTMAVRHTAEGDLSVLQRKVTGLGYQITPIKLSDAAQETGKGDALEGMHGHDIAAGSG